MCVCSGKKRYVSSKRKYVRLMPSLGCLAVFKLDSSLVPTKVPCPPPSAPPPIPSPPQSRSPSPSLASLFPCARNLQEMSRPFAECTLSIEGQL